MWENGETTTPLHADNNLLEIDGWERLLNKRDVLAKREQQFKKFKRLAIHHKKRKLQSSCMATRYKYGFEVPRDFRHAKELLSFMITS